MLFVIYDISRKLFDSDSGLLITILISLNPIIIGISQIVNPDSTLWSTSFAAFLLFFLYLKTDNDKYVYLSGFFFGLALLSKYFASILYLVFFIAVFAEHLIKREFDVENLYRRLFDLFKLYFTSILVYVILKTKTFSEVVVKRLLRLYKI